MPLENSAEVIVGRLVNRNLVLSGRKPRKAQVIGSNPLGTEARPAPRQPDLIEKMLERGNILGNVLMNNGLPFAASSTRTLPVRVCPTSLSPPTSTWL